MTNLVHLDDSQILSLMQDNAVTERFACLRDARMRLNRAAKPGCGRCGGAKKTAPSYNDLKLCLSGSSSENKRWLKNHLNTKHLRMTYTTENGRRMQLTF